MSKASQRFSLLPHWIHQLYKYAILVDTVASQRFSLLPHWIHQLYKCQKETIIFCSNEVIFFDFLRFCFTK